MIDSTLRSHVLAALPGDGWQLESLAAGHNLVLRARRAAEDLVVRIQPTRRMSDGTARALVTYLGALADDPELRVPRPVRLSGGDWFCIVERAGEPHRLSIVSWVAGEQAHSARAFVSEPTLSAVGATIARMHARSGSLDPSVAAPVPRLDADTLFGRDSALHLPALAAELDAPDHRRLLDAAPVMAGALDSQAGQTGLIHADLEPQNWVFDSTGPGVIDFDELRRGPFALDLISSLWTHALWGDEYTAARERLFAGHETVAALPPGTREHADALAAVGLYAWFEFQYRDLTAKEREPSRCHVRPMVERIVSWCSRDQRG